MLSAGRAIKNAGRITEIDVHGNPIYLRFSGIGVEDTGAIVQLGATHSRIHEPLRVRASDRNMHRVRGVAGAGKRDWLGRPIYRYTMKYFDGGLSDS